MLVVVSWKVNNKKKMNLRILVVVMYNSYSNQLIYLIKIIIVN